MQLLNGPVLRATLLGAAVYVGACALPWVGLFDADQIGDTNLYRSYGDAILDGELPYRDFYVEYPPGALPIFVAPAFAGDHYATAFKILMVVLGVATIAVVVAALRRVGAPTADLYRSALVVALAPALLGPVFLINYDLWPALLTAAALALLVGRRELLGLAALGIATAAKVYPLVLVPIALVYVARRSGLRAARNAAFTFGVAIGAIVLPFVVFAPGGFGFDLLVALRRPLQIESLGSSVLLAMHSLGFYDPSVNSDYNSQNLGGALPRAVSVASTLLEIAAVVLVWLTFAHRRPRARTLFLASAAAVTAALCFAKVLSPQFLVWLVPMVALAVRSTGVAGIGLLAGSLALTHAWFPSRYGELVALGDVAWLVLLRNLVLVTLFLWLFMRLRREPKAPLAAPSSGRAVHPRVRLK